MEYYPIKKLLKNVVPEKQKSHIPMTSLEFARSLDVSNEESPARADVSLPGIYPNSLSQSPMKRHDRVFTLSWAKKQDERRKDYLSNNTSPEPSKILSPTIVSPLNRKNRRFVTHLSSKMDNEVHKVPLYDKDKDVFDIREQNARILKQIISNKHAHQVEFNKVAEENHFKQFRSSPLMKSPKSLLDDKSIGSSILSRNQRQSNQSMQLSILRTENSKTVAEDLDEVASHSLHPELPSWTTLSPARLRPEKSPTLLEGLEEIYQGDLRKRSKGRDKSDKLNSKSFSEIDKEALKLRNYKDYFEDDKLMKRLEDPYAKHLPFERPVVGGFRQGLLRELQAIETKAEVLRNIKMIDESIAKDAGLPQIQENPNEEANLDTKREEKKKSKSKKDGRTMKLWAKHMAASKAKVIKEVNNKEI